MVPAQLIVCVILRLYAIGWAFHGVSALGGALMTMDRGQPISYLSMIVWWFTAIALWFIAPKLGRLMVGNAEVAVNASSLNRRDLYAATLVGVGAFFVLRSLAKTFNWIHYFVISQQQPDEYNQKFAPTMYGFTETAITLVAALVVFFWAGEIARKIDLSHTKSEDIQPQSTEE
ncbi:MAG: hypothetical protein AAGH89_07345 [Verrucomicrobiota bacterium]